MSWINDKMYNYQIRISQIENTIKRKNKYNQSRVIIQYFDNIYKIIIFREWKLIALGIKPMVQLGRHYYI